LHARARRDVGRRTEEQPGRIRRDEEGEVTRLKTCADCFHNFPPQELNNGRCCSRYYPDVYLMHSDGTGLRRIKSRGAYTPACLPTAVDRIR
jgi:hypothetical protein